MRAPRSCYRHWSAKAKFVTEHKAPFANLQKRAAVLDRKTCRLATYKIRPEFPKNVYHRKLTCVDAKYKLFSGHKHKVTLSEKNVGLSEKQTQDPEQEQQMRLPTQNATGISGYFPRTRIHAHTRKFFCTRRRRRSLFALLLCYVHPERVHFVVLVSHSGIYANRAECCGCNSILQNFLCFVQGRQQKSSHCDRGFPLEVTICHLPAKFFQNLHTCSLASGPSALPLFPFGETIFESNNTRRSPRMLLRRVSSAWTMRRSVQFNCLP